LLHDLQTPLLEYGRKPYHNLAAAPKYFDAEPVYEDVLENRNICTHYQSELIALHVLDTMLFFETETTLIIAIAIFGVGVLVYTAQTGPLFSGLERR
jgi:hypothetical protein